MKIEATRQPLAEMRVTHMYFLLIIPPLVSIQAFAQSKRIFKRYCDQPVTLKT